MKKLIYIAIRYPRIWSYGLTRIKNKPKTIYLTFDDGPNHIITEKVLNILKNYNAKASFFCKGKNAVIYSDIIDKIKADGHMIGNHSYSHYNAFKVANKKWLKDISIKSPVRDSHFFRPPYGRILPWQYYKLKKIYKIILWDVMTYDYREDNTIEKINSIIRKNVRDGSIIVFHDTITAASKMLPALNDTLKYYIDLGYKFDKIHI